jgi:hypothetical protein
VSYRQDSYYRSSHIVAATVVSFWLTVYHSSAQSQETAFGEYRAISTPEKFERCALTHGPQGGTTFFFWNPPATELYSLGFDSACSSYSWKEHSVGGRLDDFLVADLAANQKSVGIIVNREEKRLSFVPNPFADTFRVVSTVNLHLSPTGIAVGDLNNDGRMDLLVYDHDNPGIVPFFGVGNAKFRKGLTIAPDNAVGDLALVQLNNDGLMDIVLYDWVKSELHLLYGLGRGTFLDQTTFPVQGELNKFAVTQLSTGGHLDFVLAFKDPPQLEIWKGDGLGDFRPETRIPLKEPLESFTLADVNGDGFKDLVALERPATLEVYFSAGEEPPPERIDFSAGSGPKIALLGDFNFDRLVDVAVLDREGQKLLLYFNAEQSSVLRDSLEFVTGVRPRAVSIADLIGNGTNDVAVVNSGDNSLSIFMNRLNVGLLGHTTYSLPASPWYLTFHSFKDSLARFIISYPQANELSFLTLDQRDRSITNAIISTAGGAELLSWGGGDRDLVDFFCFNSSSGSDSPSLTSFQQLGPQRFIEQSYRLTIPDSLLGAAVGDVDGDGRPDVVYIYRNATTNRYEFVVSLGDSVSSFRQKSFFYQLPLREIQKSYLWIADFNHDGKSDVLVSFPRLAQNLEVELGTGRGSFEQPDTIAQGIRIEDRGQVQILDLDGDGVLDIAVNEQNRHCVGWLRGKGDGKFEEFRPLVQAPRIGYFAFGDLNGDGVPDLAVTLSNKGTVKIYDGKRILGLRREILR